MLYRHPKGCHDVPTFYRKPRIPRMYTFTVKGFDAKGSLVTAQHYDTHKLHALNGHWQVVARMAETVKKSRKVKSLRYFVNNVEHVWNHKALEWQAV